MSDFTFTLDEFKSINDTINRINEGYHENMQLPSFLEDFMSTLRDQIYFDKSNFLFYTYDDENKRYEVSSFPNIGWSSADIDKYVDTYVHLDDILSVLAVEKPLAIKDGDIFSEEDRKKTAYFHEFIEPAQISKSIDANLPLKNSSGIYVIMGLFRDFGRKDFTDKDVEIIRSYQPHLTNLVDRHLQNHGFETSDDFFKFLTRFASLGICVMDARHNITMLNDTFKRIVRTDKRSSEDDNELTRSIQKACHLIESTPNLCKSGPTEIIMKGKTYFMEIVRHISQTGVARFICILYDYDDMFMLKLSNVRNKYHLTNREYEILMLMLKQGWSIDELSRELIISDSTVNKHISSIYAKLGVSSQKQLIALIK
jgi:DNA-binding CsgD family transcriptional regulator